MGNTNRFNSSRRHFIHNVGLATLGVTTLSSFDFGSPQESPADRVKKAKADGKLGIALVGLGGYAGGQLAPALQQTKHCYLAGIVTGTPAKAEQWKEKYAIPEGNIYNYQTFDKIKDNPDIDIIYVELPNSMHAENILRPAQAGKHVRCEKPMALTVEDRDTTIAACKKARKPISDSYRVPFEP